MTKQKIIITLGSEIVLAGSRNLSIVNNILSFNDDRFIYWPYSNQSLKIRIGYGESERIEYGCYINGRTQGNTINIKLHS